MRKRDVPFAVFAALLRKRHLKIYQATRIIAAAFGDPATPARLDCGTDADASARQERQGETASLDRPADERWNRKNQEV